MREHRTENEVKALDFGLTCLIPVYLMIDIQNFLSNFYFKQDSDDLDECEKLPDFSVSIFPVLSSYPSNLLKSEDNIVEFGVIIITAIIIMKVRPTHPTAANSGWGHRPQVTRKHHI